MPFLANLLGAIIEVFDMLLTAYSFIVIAYCIISWVNPDPYNPIVRFLRSATEPVLRRIRKYLPFTNFNGLDLSPIALLIGIHFFKRVVILSLVQLSMGM
jgi:Predicted integral membrane protein